MGENGSVKVNRGKKLSEYTEKEFPEIRILTQEAVNEQIKGFIAPLTRQLEELTALVRGMVTKPHPSHHPRTGYSNISGRVAHQPYTYFYGFRELFVFVFEFFQNSIFLELERNNFCWCWSSPGLTAMVKHDGQASSWYNHGDS